MFKLFVLNILFVFTFMSTPAYANTAGNQLGTCMIDSLSGKERKSLAKWIFVAMAAHPEIKSLTKISSKERLSTDKTIGALITRLLATDCPNQLQAATKADPAAINGAFELVGKVAMQELMTDASVNKAISNYANYTDQKKLNALFKK